MKADNFEKTYKVYKHVFPNGKVYIGITSQPLNCRWRSGKGYNHNIHITRAIEKYGWDNVQHFVLKGDFTLDEANSIERALIQKYKSNNPEFGYNVTAGGDGRLGHSHVCSEETRQKISLINKGRTRSEEYKKHLSELRSGKKLPPEVVEKIAIGHLGLKHTDEWVQEMRERSKGYKRDASGRFVRR